MGDTALALQYPGAFELDVLGSEVVEQPSPLAEEHRDDVELDLIKDAGSERTLAAAAGDDRTVHGAATAQPVRRPSSRWR